MKTANKWISSILTACLIFGMLTVPAFAQTDAGGITVALQGNSGAVISADEAILTVVTDEALASVSIEGNTARISAVTDDAVMVTAKVETASQSTELEIPLGYTTFCFSGDSLTVYEGSDDKYEIAGINMADEEYLEGDSSYPLPVEYDADGNAVYKNTDIYSINVAVKKKGGSYVFCGQSNNMSISVKKEATGAAKLILAGLELASDFTAPITVKKDSSSTVEIYNPAGFVNTLTDSELNNEDLHGEEGTVDTVNPEYAESAVIKGKAKANISISGGGVLNLNSNSKNAVKVSEYGVLTVRDVNLVVNSVNHGLSSDNKLEIQSGTIQITCGGDGIRSDPDTVDADAGAAGEILISGGDITIAADSDGIQANELLTITDGTFHIRTGDGYDDSDFDPDTESCKGLKVSVNTDDSDDTAESTCTLDVSGGTFYLNCADDAVHSDGYIVLTGGSFYIWTGDDGVHADTSLTIGTENANLRVPKITVTASYEGLEAGNIYIYDGDISVTASDDGINAAGGSDSTDTNTGFNPGGMPGRPGQSSSSTTVAYSINVYGGKIFINASSDGFDSNGALSLLGGEIVVWGASSGDGEPLDHDGTMTINGATILSLGQNSMSSLSTNSSQKSISSRTTVQADKTINVVYNGTTVFNTKAVKSCSYMMFSSPDMTSTTGWSIVIDNSELLEGCAHSSVTTVTENEVDADCDEGGSYDTVIYCKSCGEELSRSTVPTSALGHTPGETVVENEADAGCDKGASYDEVTYCESCGEELSRSTVSTSAMVHTPGETVVENEVDAGCDEGGSYDKVTYCKECGTEISRTTVDTLPAGHVSGEPVIESHGGESCEDASYYEKTVYCERCGDVLEQTREDREGTEHSYGAWTVEREPNYLTEGCRVRVCSACGAKETESLGTLDNPFTDVEESMYYNVPVLWAAENGITTGATQTTFAPESTCTRGQVVTFLWRSMGCPEPAASQCGFEDVKPEDYFYDAVLWAVEQGITVGTSSTTFSPEEPCTRAHVVTFLWRAGGEPSAQTDQCAFTDVAQNMYYKEPVLWAVENGITLGTSENTFSPDAPCTRGQIVTFLQRALNGV